MTDRELLEPAANAAGIPPKVGECGTTEDDDRRLTLGQLNALLWPVSITGEGLSDLGFEPVERESSCPYRLSDAPRICMAIAVHVRESAFELAYQMSNNDKLEATRRAIVRAAAKIGKEMK